MSLLYFLLVLKLRVSLKKKRRQELTNMVASSSGCMEADEVAEKALNGIKCGTFIIPCNFEGVMLAIATAGFYPQNSCLGPIVEVIGAGFMRFVSLCFQWNWFRFIEMYHAKRNGKSYIYIYIYC
ncbi:putative 3-dehydrosphinganine reductase [Dioscorea sansibarensis]